MSVVGYKRFNPGFIDYTGFKYEIGKIYTLDNGEISLEEKLKFYKNGNGFNFCRKLKDVFRGYPFEGFDFAVVEALDDVINYCYGEDSITNKIKIVKKLTLEEIMSQINSDITEQCDIENGVLSGVCEILETFTIPDNITSIGGSAFRGCEKLTEINIPDSVTSINFSAFAGCENITTIRIPKGVPSIADCAFNDCKNLETIAIPDSVKFIGEFAFFRCENLTDVYYNGTEKQWRKIKIAKKGNECLTSAKIHYKEDNV